MGNRETKEIDGYKWMRVDEVIDSIDGYNKDNKRLRAELSAKNAEIEALKQENDAIRQEAADWRSAKYIAEQKETAVHLALNDMRKERDALAKVLEAADALVSVSGYAAQIIDGLQSGKTETTAVIRVLVKAYKEARDA